MIKLLIRWIGATLAVIVTAYLLPGVHLSGFLAAFVTALVLGMINSIIKPVLVALTFPINILTFGLFTLVINALLVILASYIVPGFKVDGFWWALAFSVVLSLVTWFLNKLSR